MYLPSFCVMPVHTCRPCFEPFIAYPQFKEFSGGDDASASDLFRSEREQQAELQRRAEADRISAVPGLQCVTSLLLISFPAVKIPTPFGFLNRENINFLYVPGLQYFPLLISLFEAY